MRTKLIALGLLVVATVAAYGQAQRQPATLDDLLNEVRALRAELRQTTRATTQMQLLTVRLQLQEQRLAVLSNQHADVQTRLGLETRLRADAEAQVQRFDEMKSRNESLGISRAELDAQEFAFRRPLVQHRDAERDLRAQEADLAAQIAAEQNRWQDFNSRLDELERSLK
jgi:chromosome segregation ATPase